MVKSDPLAAPAIDLAEADCQTQVLEVAALYGWRHLHIPTTQLGDDYLTAGTTGWCDLVLWKPGRGVRRRVRVAPPRLGRGHGRPGPERNRPMTCVILLEALGMRR